MAEGDRTDVVETTAGPVEGEHRRGVARFKGIPYAAPPVGRLRFAAPEPAEPWDGVLAAVGRPPTAPQPLGATEAMAGVTEPPPQSEERCLTLNVWTEDVSGPPRPVMVWIHGGAFVSGTGTTPWYDGANLAKRGVVVVTLNYRLGAFGFLHLAGIGGESFAGSGAAGLLDQALALRWVHDNIAAFGGDPADVTIFGESAGGMSVATHLGLPASAGLFRAAIPQSGAASHVHDADSGERVALAVLDALGLRRDEVHRIREAPTERLLEAQVKVNGDAGASTTLPFRPTVDGDALPGRPLERIAAGSAAGVALLTGWNEQEMRLFTAMDPSLSSVDEARLLRLAARHVGEARAGDAVAVYRRELGSAATPLEVLEAIMTDATFRIPAIRLLDAQAAHAPSRAYEFRFRSRSFGGRLGAAHAVEIPFAFDNLDAPGAAVFTGEPDEPMRGLAAAMADAWTAFARTGSPGGGSLPPWPTYDTAARPTMVLDVEPAVEADPGSATRRLWEGIDG